MDKDGMTTFLFRLPASLKEKLSKKAKEENKSVNAKVNATRLEDTKLRKMPTYLLVAS